MTKEEKIFNDLAELDDKGKVKILTIGMALLVAEVIPGKQEEFSGMLYSMISDMIVDMRSHIENGTMPTFH